MYAIYKLKAEELDGQFLETLKTAFRNKDIEVTVSDIDETEYLLRSPSNREHLLKAVADVAIQREILVPDQNTFQ